MRDPSPTPAAAAIRPLPLAVAAALSIGNLFLHKPISDVCDALFEWLGRGWYEVISLTAIALVCSIAALPALRRLGAALATTWLPVSLVGLALLTAAGQRWLLVSNIELIHFPQFALISALFLAAGLQPLPAWVLGTTAGLLDETYQHLVIYAGVPNTYFDINDIVLNAIGAAWGVCLFGAGRLAERGPRLSNRRRWAAAAAACAVAIGVSLYLDPPDPKLLRPAATRRLYRVLSLGEGIAAIAAAAVLVDVGARRRSRGTRQDGA